MSSGSDIDEDELLQIALREQAERDLSYQKPPRASARPVVNLVQPPPPPPATSSSGRDRRGPSANPRAAARPNPAPAKARNPSRGGADDDDDSEVALLSISSGDEDASKDRAPPPPRNRAAGGDRRGSTDDGDLGWDDDEPRSWKKVDEAEVGTFLFQFRSEVTFLLRFLLILAPNLFKRRYIQYNSSDFNVFIY